MNNIKRREALKRTAYIMGGTLMAPTIAGILNGCSAEPGLDWTPTFFSNEQARLVSTVADIILPETDTPAASALGVPKFIEDMVSQVSTETSRNHFMEKMAEFEQACMSKTGKLFIALAPVHQQEFVMVEHTIIEGNKSIPWDNKPFIWLIKELTIAGYFTTEIGMTQILNYKAIPAEYKGCTTLEEAGGKTWAT